MTFRAIIIGLVAATLIGAGSQFGKIMPIPRLVRGHLPVTVFGTMIVYVAVINPLLGLMWRRMRLRAPEIALIFALLLIGCGISDAGLMRFFPSSAITPIEENRLNPGWQKSGLLALTPPELLAGGGQYTREVVGNYMRAMGDPGRPIGVDGGLAPLVGGGASA